MADDKVHPTATEMDYPAHFRNYSRFSHALEVGRHPGGDRDRVVLYTISN